jgi:hypothetical protein
MSDTKGLLSGLEGFANELIFTDPISVPLVELISNFLPGTRLVDVHATTDGRLEIYLNFEDELQPIPDNAGAGSIFPTRFNGSPGTSSLLWLLLALVILSLRKLPIALRSTCFALCLGGLAFAPGCEQTHLTTNCTRDTDCAQGYFCNTDNTCVLGVPCGENADCCLGAICVAGFCTNGPDCDNTGCPFTGTSCVDGLCLAQTCDEATPCPSPSLCEFGYCTYLVCPEGRVLDRPGARCMNIPDSCANLNCSPGTRPEIVNGPLSGPDCPDESVECTCTEARPIDGPRPSGSIAAGPNGEVFWYDHQYGDLIVTDLQDATESLDGLLTSKKSIVLDGLPTNGQANGSKSGWRDGVEEPGPNVGRSVSSFILSDETTLIAALKEPNRGVIVYAYDAENTNAIPVMEYPGRVLAGPILHPSPEGRTCVSFVHSSGDNGRSLRVFCTHRPDQSGSFSESLSVPLSPSGLTPDACGSGGCPSETHCVGAPGGPPTCAAPSTDCEPACGKGRRCVLEHGCAPVVYPQDLMHSSTTGFLSASESDGPIVFVTSTVSPSQVVALRWFGAQNYTLAPLLDLPAAGGRGALGAAAIHWNNHTQILVGIDSWPHLYLFDWVIGEEVPQLLAAEDLNLAQGPRSRIREIRPGPTSDDGSSWLVRVQPDDILLWIRVAGDGIETLALLSEQAVLGQSDYLDDLLWGWRIEAASESFMIHQWSIQSTE